MRAFKVFICVITITLLFSGCTQIISRVFFGMEAPKNESPSSIIRYGKKIGLNTKENFFYIDSNEVRTIWKGIAPKTFIYDEEGNIYSILSCFATQIYDLQKFYRQSPDSITKIANIEYHIFGKDTIVLKVPEFGWVKNTLRSFDNSIKKKLPSSKYYIVYYWTKAYGKINKKRLAAIEKYINTHPEFSSTLIKVNIDFQKTWGYNTKDIKKL